MVKSQYRINPKENAFLANCKVFLYRQTLKNDRTTIFKRKNYRILVFGKKKVISENPKLVEVFNEYFVSIVKDLGISEIPIINGISLIYCSWKKKPVPKYKTHPSILKNEGEGMDSTTRFGQLQFRPYLLNRLLSQNPLPLVLKLLSSSFKISKNYGIIIIYFLLTWAYFLNDYSKIYFFVWLP